MLCIPHDFTFRNTEEVIVYVEMTGLVLRNVCYTKTKFGGQEQTKFMHCLLSFEV